LKARPSIAANRGTLTPYVGKDPFKERKAVAAVGGNRYLLTARECARCVHSLYAVDRSPLACRIGLCDLPLPRELSSRIDASLTYGSSTLSRFWFLQRLAKRGEAPSAPDAQALLSDARVVDADEKNSCLFLTNHPGLYRIKDLAYLLLFRADGASFVASAFSERDKAIAARLRE
jgi:hypothetical protein